MARRDLRDSPVYRQCQKKLLKQEIIKKKRRVRLVKKDLSSFKNELMFKLKWIDFHHACNLFLRVFIHIKILKVKSSVNFQTLTLKSYDPEQVIPNLSSHDLTEAKISVLCRGLLTETLKLQT